MRKVTTLVLVAVLVLVAGACGGDRDIDVGSGTGGAEDATIGPGEGAGDGVAFTAELLGGGTLSSADLADRDVVLWFWAPWCTTCRREAPEVMAATAAVGDRVEVIGVAGRGEVADMERFLTDTGTGGLRHVIDDDGAIWAAYGVLSQPTYAFVAADGGTDVVLGALGEAALVERMRALAG